MKLRSSRIAPVVLVAFCSSIIWASSCAAHVDPAYPPIAKAALLTGDVFVEITLDAAGKITQATAKAMNMGGWRAGRLKDADRYSAIFENAALNNIRRWDFSSCKSNPVRKLRVTYRYEMVGERTPSPKTLVRYPSPNEVDIVTAPPQMNID